MQNSCDNSPAASDQYLAASVCAVRCSALEWIGLLATACQQRFFPVCPHWLAFAPAHAQHGGLYAASHDLTWRPRRFHDDI
jgi:hypothetical protein